jgi:hypothetical protein
MQLETASGSEPLWVPVVAPSIWSLHFMLCYATAAVWCGRFSPPPSPGIRTLVAVFTVGALAAIALFFHHGFSRLRYRLPMRPLDDDTPGDREQFVAFTTMLLAGMSLVAVVFEAIAIAVVNRCSP